MESRSSRIHLHIERRKLHSLLFSSGMMCQANNDERVRIPKPHRAALTPLGKPS